VLLTSNVDISGYVITSFGAVVSLRGDCGAACRSPKEALSTCEIGLNGMQNRLYRNLKEPILEREIGSFASQKSLFWKMNTILWSVNDFIFGQ